MSAEDPGQAGDAEVEALLARFRPAEPGETLRGRVLGELLVPVRRRARWGTMLYRGAVAAMLVISAGLMVRSRQLEREIARQIGPGATRWTPEAQAAADLVGPGEPGRQYVAMGLAASDAKLGGQAMQGAMP